MLVVGITMNCAGTEKSFLSFADCLDYDKYDVTLLLAKKEGLFLDLLPKEIKVIEMERYGDMFTLSGANAAKVIARDFCRKNPLVCFELLPYVIKTVLCPKKRSFTAMRLWVHMMRRFPEVKGEYDIALAYWGDKSMFYTVDKVKAKKKIAWLHFDYANPPRDDGLYEPYFAACDKVVTVSDKVDASLRAKLPSIAEKCVLMENIQNTRLIRSMAEKGERFTDDFDGKRILTVGRVSEQKGYDIALEALIRLVNDGHNVRWYILGGGDAADINALKSRAREAGVSDRLVFLGTTQNPYGYMKSCDIYAQPSRHEGKPIAVEEAKVLCRPIYISNYLSASEQLSDGKYGVIGEIGVEGTYEGISKLLNDGELRDALINNLSETDFGNMDEINVFYDMIKE